MNNKNIEKGPGWKIEDVNTDSDSDSDSNSEVRADDEYSTSSSSRSSSNSYMNLEDTIKNDTTNKVNIDISNIQQLDNDEISICIKKIKQRHEYLIRQITNFLNKKSLLKPEEYENLLIKIIKRGFYIPKDILEEMKKCQPLNDDYCKVITNLKEEYNKLLVNKNLLIDIKTFNGGKRDTRKIKKTNKKTKKFHGKIRKHKKSRKTRKFQNAIKKKR